MPTIRFVPGGDVAVAPAGWTTHPRGAFRRSGEWFVDVTQGRAPRYPYASWRVMATPAVPAEVPAKTGGDYYRHATEGATDLGEFDTYSLALKAGDRWLKAQNREHLQGAWVGRADW